MKSADFRCYDSQTGATATTATVAAGSQLGIWADQAVYHPGVVNVYMAKAPGDVASWDGSGNVWFKVYQVSAVTDGGKTISWPAENQPGYTFTIPKNLPSGQYLVRIEQIALHVAQTYGGAQFYVRCVRASSSVQGTILKDAAFQISCGQINVTGGGSGTPGPLVAIPGVYTGNVSALHASIFVELF